MRGAQFDAAELRKLPLGGQFLRPGGTIPVTLPGIALRKLIPPEGRSTGAINLQD
jgi:hypothetical protein